MDLIKDKGLFSMPMTCIAGIVLGIAVLIIGVFWRFASRQESIPCPAWLGWMVELDNPILRKQRQRNPFPPGTDTRDAGAGFRLRTGQADHPGLQAGCPGWNGNRIRYPGGDVWSVSARKPGASVLTTSNTFRELQVRGS